MTDDWTLAGRKRERVRAGGLRADLVHRDHGGSALARAAHLRSRRRRLRHRRRPCRPDHGARDRAARLVGRRAGNAPHRLGGVRPQRWLRPARLCRDHGPDRQPRRARSRQGAVGALGDGTQIREHDHCRGPHAGRRPDGRLAQGLQGRQRRRDIGSGAALRPGAGRRHRRLADRSRARGAAQQALLPRHALAARVPHPSAQLCARARGRGGSGGRAHLRADPGAVDRCRRRAQAHRNAVRPRARQPYRARLQCPSRVADATDCRDAGADLELRGRHRAARAPRWARPSPIAAR
jgi:hypothetical protein